MRKILILTSLLWSGSVLAQVQGVYFSNLKLEVRSEAKHNEFRIPSNAYEAAHSFCRDLGFKKPVSLYHHKVRGEWEVADVICTNESEVPRSLRQAAKAHIAKERMSRNLEVDRESKVLADYMIIKENLFKKGEIKTPKSSKGWALFRNKKASHGRR